MINLTASVARFHLARRSNSLKFSGSRSESAHSLQEFKSMTIQFSVSQDLSETSGAPCVVVGVFDDRTLTSAAARVDEKSGGAIKRLLESGDVSGKVGSSSVLFALPGVATPRVLVVGLGEPKKFDAARFARAASEAARALKGLPIDRAVSYLTEVDVPGKDAAWKLRTAALATDAQAYKYTA